MDDIPGKAIVLMSLTDAAIAEAAVHKTRFKNEAINWGDLRCVEARHYLNHRGEAGWQVTIEEAAPGGSLFVTFIAVYLRENGWPDVEVTMEW